MSVSTPSALEEPLVLGDPEHFPARGPLAGFADPRRPECGLVVEPGEVPRLRSVVCLAGCPCRHVFMVRSGQIRRRRGGWRMARRFPAVIVSGCRAWVCPEEEGESCGADARPSGRIQGRSGGLYGPVTAATMRAWSLPCSWSRQLLLSGGWPGIRGGGGVQKVVFWVVLLAILWVVVTRYSAPHPGG